MTYEPVTGSSMGSVIAVSFIHSFISYTLQQHYSGAQIKETVKACMGEMKNTNKTSVRNLKGRDHSRHTGKDSKIILKWIMMKWGVSFRVETS
jgi:hypothetical protein